MSLANLKFLYRLVINRHSTHPWEKALFDATYMEFLMQQQLFNSKEEPAHSFKELLKKNPAAGELHYLVGIAAHTYVLQWEGKIYRVPDNSNKTYLPFNEYRLDIIESHIEDKTQHEIALSFFSPLLLLVDKISDYVIVAEKEEKADNGRSAYITQTYKMQPLLSVCYYEALDMPS